VEEKGGLIWAREGGYVFLRFSTHLQPLPTSLHHPFLLDSLSPTTNQSNPLIRELPLMDSHYRLLMGALVPGKSRIGKGDTTLSVQISCAVTFLGARQRYVHAIVSDFAGGTIHREEVRKQEQASTVLRASPPTTRVR
jgi:hypothetical protein